MLSLGIKATKPSPLPGSASPPRKGYTQHSRVPFFVLLLLLSSARATCTLTRYNVRQEALRVQKEEEKLKKAEEKKKKEEERERKKKELEEKVLLDS